MSACGVDPYRHAPSAPKPSSPAGTRARIRFPRLSATLACALSLLAHVGVLWGTAVAPHPSPPGNQGTQRDSSGDPWPYFIHPAPWCYARTCMVSALPIHLAACFHEDLLASEGWCSYGLEPETSPFPADAPGGWVRVAAQRIPGDSDREEPDASLVEEAMHDCMNIAAATSWKKGGRVFIRMDRVDDSTAIVRAEPLDEDARHEGLLCCLRQAQTGAARRLGDGEALRFVLHFHDGEMSVEEKVVTSKRAASGPKGAN